MAQYRPCHHADRIPALSRALTSSEYTAAVSLAGDAGLRLDQRRSWFPGG